MPRYAGMANYQTSSVKLHSTLTPDLFDSSVKLAGEHIASAKAELGAAMVALEPGTVTELAEYTLAKAIADQWRDGIPDEVQGAYRDLLNASLEEVDWQEIARSFISAAKDEESR
jgi:hypothetical protein